MSFLDFAPKSNAKTAQLPGVPFSSRGAPGPQGSLPSANGLLAPKFLYENGADWQITGYPQPINRQYQLNYGGRTLPQSNLDIDPGTITFSCTQRKPVGNSMGMKNRGNVNPEPPIKLKSLPRMNYYLRSEEGRMMFPGDREGIAKFCKEWIMLGVTITAPTQDSMRKSEANVTVSIVKRARMPDIWLAGGTLPKMGDWLWLYIRPVQEKKEDIKSQSSDGEDEVKVRAPTSYIQIDPFITTERNSPPTALEAAGGRVQYVGVVSETHGDVHVSKDTDNAKAAVYPTTDTDAYKRQLAVLPAIAVMLQVKG